MYAAHLVRSWSLRWRGTLAFQARGRGFDSYHEHYAVRETEQLRPPNANVRQNMGTGVVCPNTRVLET